jgi:histidinol-phosphate/aromatic aminotransferase/cobyric acid decarboxylase-like protein
MKGLGITTQAGEVHYELMTASTDEVHAAISEHALQLNRIERSVEWRLPFAFRPAAHRVHGGSFWEVLGDEFADLSRATEVVNADVLDAWFDPAPEVISALQQNLPMLVRTSPPTHAEGMVRAISRARAVPESCLLAAAGSSALIFSAFRTWLNPNSRVLLLDPMYGEYRHVFENIIGCTVESVVGKSANGFRINLDQLAEQVTRGYDAVVLVNPNSPTGTLLSRPELTKLFTRCAGTRFWVDETYIEFAGAEHSVEQFAAKSDYVFVCKSMSKAYALSGLRAAYMVGPEAEIARLGKLLPPWSVSLPAQIAAVAALSSADYYSEQYRRTAELREQLAAGPRERCGIIAFPSVTNCLLCELPAGAPDAADIMRRTRKQNVFLRSGEEIHSSLGSRTIRIAVKGSEMNLRVIEVLETIVLDSVR